MPRMTDPASLPYRPCVGVVLMNGAGEVFAAERIDTPGAWQMPQGGIDEGETPESAALRELTEEISVPAGAVELVARTRDWVTYDLPPELIGKAWGGRYRGQKQLWFLLRLVGDESQIDLATPHPEFRAWRWMRADALIAAIVPFKRAVYAQVLDEFAPHLA
ncbi:RNA pyrophosphohydrolase [Halovulum dunhuangense]|uniref:RNA pyrophosphohydrolase n=1 Tax=Halovulum dunhuangense TaxID=1505036 RepID=A0A849KU97_9RHOB|nr:RNA pyrophosphohydrolase [Halovulum dunhuangense]NNU78838.1 RNA pyrophosphohydrolase [Halovulum dunhuangense]